MKAIIVVSLFLIPIIFLIKQLKKENIEKIDKKYAIIITCILLLGTFARIYEIDKMPNALNCDEASSGYEAYSILNYGIDRAGNSNPVFLYSWGSGQNALYSYMIMPFLVFNELDEFWIRIPMAILGIASLYVMYYLLKNIFDNPKIVLLGTFFFAICPWHVMKSRWGLEANVFPDLVLISVLLLVFGLKHKKTIFKVFAFVLLGLCSYSYGTSYLFLPVFVGLLLLTLLIKKEIKLKHAFLYLGIVFIIALPIILFIVINTFDLPEFDILGFTIPRLKSNRYQEISTIFSGNVYNNCVENIISWVRLFFMQKDGLAWNALEVHGLFYYVSIPIFFIGLLESDRKYRDNIYNKIMGIWMIASIVVAAFCYININRINIIMIPCIYYIIIGLSVICSKYKIITALVCIMYLGLFTSFSYHYMNQDFNNYGTFTSGIEEIVDYCEERKDKEVYCVYSFKEPFIYFLFYSEYDTRNFVETVEKFDENGVFENIKSFGRYNFHLPQVMKDDIIIIVPQNQYTYYQYTCESKTSINQFDIYEY